MSDGYYSRVAVKTSSNGLLNHLIRLIICNKNLDQDMESSICGPFYLWQKLLKLQNGLDYFIEKE
jgi:hypothetical protein